MPRTRTVVVGLSALGLCLVGVTVAGPLDPPAGPVTQTDPSLGDVLSAVQAGAGPSCTNAPALAGAPSTGSMTISGLGTFDVLEFALGAETSPSNFGTGATLPSRKLITVARLADGSSAPLLQALVSNTFLPGATITQSNPGASYAFTEIRPIAISNELRRTCDGALSVELVTFEFRTFEISAGGSTFGWDFRDNVALPPS